MNTSRVTQAVQKSKGLFISIGVKLIGIVSLIMICSLAGMTILATASFSNDVERSIKFNTLDRADLIAQKLETELQSYISTGQAIASSLDSTDKRLIGGSVSEQLLKQNPAFLGVWIVGQNDRGFSVLTSVFSEERLNGLALLVPPTDSLLANYADNFGECFAGAQVLENVSPDFNYPVLALAFPNVWKNDHEAESIAIVILTMDQMIESLKSRELYRSYLVDHRGILLASAEQKLVLSRPSLKDSPIVKDLLEAGADNKQLQFSDEQGRAYSITPMKMNNNNNSGYTHLFVSTLTPNVCLMRPTKPLLRTAQTNPITKKIPAIATVRFASLVGGRKNGVATCDTDKNAPGCS